MKASFPRALEIEAYAFSALADAIEPQLQEVSSGDTATPPRRTSSPAQAVRQDDVPRS
jgi:hypothetical protein